MRQTRVVVVGSANMDLVGTGPTLPRPGETVLGSDFVTVPGGKGANQAIAAVRAGASCAFLGAIGSDAFGVTLRARSPPPGWTPASYGWSTARPGWRWSWSTPSARTPSW